MAKLTLEGLAVSAAVGGGDLAAEFADQKGIALGPLSASDVLRTAEVLVGAGLNYTNMELGYSDKVVYAALPLWEKTLANWALKAMGKPKTFAGVRAVTVKAASSGLAQYANPALTGTYRSIPQ